MVHPVLSFMQHILEEQNNLYDIKLQYRNDDKEYLSILEKSILEFWKKKGLELIKVFNSNQFTWEDFECIRDFMQILRGYFFMNLSFKTISKEYQEICAFFIALTFQKKVLWANNFLKYFDPNSAYYNRIKALTLFRVLQNPKKEIEGKLQEVSDLLYISVQKEPESFSKALNILKEYVDRVFSLTCKTVEARVDFVVENVFPSWIFWCWQVEFSSWLVAFFEEDSIGYEPTIEEIRDADRKEIISYFKQKEYELSKIREEKIWELEKRIDELQRESKKLHQSLCSLSTVSSVDSEVFLWEKRQFYKILIIGGADKANKWYNKLRKDKPNFLEDFGLNWGQLELRGSYQLQKDRKFVKSIEDSLLLEFVNFILVLQTDHESPFVKLLENPELSNRITVFAEREWKNNPFCSSQKFSQDRFYFYLKKALEKYEREIENTKTSILE